MTDTNKSELVSSFSEDWLLTRFPSLPIGVLSYIGQICYDVDDPEAVKETTPFLNKRWTEISPDMWRTNWTAVSFFSDFAFYYFLPSIIHCSYKDGEQSHLAVSKVIATLSPCSLPLMEDWRRRQWQQFNQRQVECVISWLENLGPEVSEFFSETEVLMAISALYTLKQRAEDLERALGGPTS